jgi:2-methylaconitate cis-trans-isomerase PrpF
MSSLNLNLASEQATPELVIEAAATGRTGLESARVLLVDDSVMLRMGLRRSL